MIPPTSRHDPTPAARAVPPDEASAPRPLADRLRLLLILVLLPGLAVMVPTLIVTGIFGQRPKPKAPPAADVSGASNPLRLSLERSAVGLLPPPTALSPDPVVVTVRADHLTARMETISRQAAGFGGSATEGLSTASEKRLSVDVPAGSADAFRQAVKSRTAAASPAPSATAGGRDYVEVIIRAAGDDE